MQGGPLQFMVLSSPSPLDVPAPHLNLDNSLGLTGLANPPFDLLVLVSVSIPRIPLLWPHTLHSVCKQAKQRRVRTIAMSVFLFPPRSLLPIPHSPTCLPATPPSPVPHSTDKPKAQPLKQKPGGSNSEEWPPTERAVY